MSKRFRDREIWLKGWYRKLSPAEKCAWNYILDHCDSIGVWGADCDLAELYIGESIDWQGLPGKCNGNITILDSGEWWVIEYCIFHYGEEFSESNRAHVGYMKKLISKGLWSLFCAVKDKQFKDPTWTLHGPSMDPSYINSLNLNIKNSLKSAEKTKMGEFGNVALSDAELAKFRAEMGEKKTAACIERLSAYKASSGKTYKSDAAAIRNWVISDLDKRFPGAYTVSRDFSTAPAPTEEEARPPTESELAEVEAMKRRALDTPQGKMLLGIIGGES